MNRSRTGLYKSRGVKSKSHFYLLLSIIFFAILVIWGVPGIINFIAGSGTGKKDVSNKTSVIPPQKPVLSSMPEATNSAEIRVGGYTKANISLELLVDDLTVATTNSESDGSFELTIDIEPGAHRIMVRAKDEAGNTSDSDVKIISFDPNGVEITITEPADGASLYSLDKNTVIVKGNVNKEDVNIRVNGIFTRLEADSSFQQTVTLGDGDNTIKVTATDKAGNFTEKSITVKYSH